MKLTHQDFIGLYEDAISKEECQAIIDRLNEHMEIKTPTIRKGEDQFPVGAIGRMDYQVFAHKLFGKVSNDINMVLDKCIQLYADEFFVLKNVGNLRSEEIKLQMTPPKGGYHVWHCEQDARQHSDRVLAWTLYLNDIPDGEGETEFLWQGLRVKPKAGRLCIFPAAFTHSHRGNPVYSCDKYIATGWFTFVD